MLKAGLARPSRLVSLRSVEERYRNISFTRDGTLHAGAMTSLRQLERSVEIAERFPAISDALGVLANVRVRNVATLGGSLAHADPHMDLPPTLIALGASVHTTGPSGERTLEAEELIVGYFETVLGNDELISEISVPRQDDCCSSYVKCTTRSADDWPALGVAVSMHMHLGRIEKARIVIGAATETPVRSPSAEARLIGSPAKEEDILAAADAAANDTNVIGDALGSDEYKRQLIRIYAARAVRKALARRKTGAKH
jgi:carbon-monoxide dehydrogenase medium subunit